MAAHDLNVSDLDTLVEDLGTAGIDSVGFDPAQLNLPGVWVNVTGFQTLTLQGLSVRLELIALSPNTDPRIALEVVQPVFNSILAALQAYGGPTGDPFTGVWQFGESKTRYPGIAVPLDLLTTQES